MLDLDYRALRSAISMEQVLSLLDFRPAHRRGPQLRGPCPLHDPSRTGDGRCFSVHLERGMFHCFGCGSSGNPLDLWVQWQSQPLYAAALALCRELGLDPPWKAP
jgi:DNA primase